MTANLLRMFAIAACFSMVGCETVDEDDDEPQRRGYGLDNPPAGPGRYLATRVSETPPSTSMTEVTTTTTTSQTVEEPVVTEPVTPPPPTSTTVVPPTPPAPPKPPVANTPSYGKPVPGKSGFVYPPGVEAKPENMVDVRDFSPGQKVRDPRTGDIFLVP